MRLMLFSRRSAYLSCAIWCVLLSGCSDDAGAPAKKLHKVGQHNMYSSDAYAGWVWQGSGAEVESETQIWQLSLPPSAPNWTSPYRFYPPPFPDQANWDIKTTGDFDGNGSADFLWRHKTTGAWRVWQMKNGIRQGQNNLPDYDVAHLWTVVAAGDTDQDGDDDVVLNNTDSGEILIWEMQAHALRAAHPVGSKAAYVVSRVGDFNRDGDVDLMLRKSDGNRLSVWEIESHALVQEHPFPGTNRNWIQACAGDADNDGDDDILLVDSVHNRERWLVIENYQRVKQLVGAGSVGFSFLACGDYDGDGDADILWHSPADGRNRVILQQDYGTRKRTVNLNPFGGTDPSAAGYGFEYRGNNN